MNYANEWLYGCFSTPAGGTITAYFKDGRDPATYPAGLYDLLKSDQLVSCITSDETGEILFDGGL